MRNNIEILRAICFDSEDIQNIQNIDEYNFKDLEIEFMVEFKKIYELGLNQLEKFINKLDEEGKDLEPWDIEYYLNHLLNGPLGNYARELGKDKKYFVSVPDILGVVGNNQTSIHNTTLYTDGTYPLGTNVDVYNKSPKFIQDLITNSSKIVETVFRSSMGASIINDNTLPIADKAPQMRYQEEKTGKWVTRSNASYCVKDSFYSVVMEETRQKIFDKVKELVQEENFHIFKDRKTFNPFGNDNDATSEIYEFEKKIIEGENEQILKLDIMGDVFDDRGAVLKVETPEKNKEYVLNTVEGQFGS